MFNKKTHKEIILLQLNMNYVKDKGDS